MSDDPIEVRIAVVESRQQNIKDDVAELKTNQKWGVLTILGLMAKAAFDFFSKGGPN